MRRLGVRMVLVVEVVLHAEGHDEHASLSREEAGRRASARDENQINRGSSGGSSSGRFRARVRGGRRTMTCLSGARLPVWMKARR